MFASQRRQMLQFSSRGLTSASGQQKRAFKPYKSMADFTSSQYNLIHAKKEALPPAYFTELYKAVDESQDKERFFRAMVPELRDKLASGMYRNQIYKLLHPFAKIGTEGTDSMLRDLIQFQIVDELSYNNYANPLMSHNKAEITKYMNDFGTGFFEGQGHHNDSKQNGERKRVNLKLYNVRPFQILNENIKKDADKILEANFK